MDLNNSKKYYLQVEAFITGKQPRKYTKAVAGDNQVQTNERLLTNYSVYYTLNNTSHFVLKLCTVCF